MDGGERYFVRVTSDDARAMAELAEAGLDTFAGTDVRLTRELSAEAIAAGEAAEQTVHQLDALATMDQIQRLTEAGFQVFVEGPASSRARARQIVPVEQWLREMGEL